MVTSDWVLAGTTIFLGIVAIFGPAISDAIKRQLYSPEISPYFMQVPPFCLKTTYGRNGYPVYFFRFRVKNTGKTRLNNCEAVIEQLFIYDSADIPRKIDSFTDVSLLWANSNKQFIIDISPNRSKYCDIGHISSYEYQNRVERYLFENPQELDENNLRFLFELPYFPNSQQNDLEPGKYAIKIVLYSDNADKKELFFKIIWTGRWKDNISGMFRELVISEIEPL